MNRRANIEVRGHLFATLLTGHTADTQTRPNALPGPLNRSVKRLDVSKGLA